MKSLILSLLLVVAGQITQAAVLTTEPGNSTIEGVNIAKDGTIEVEGRSAKVVSVGAGLRSKKVALFNVKVYVAQLLVSDASKYVRTDAGALDSVNKMQAAAIQLQFVRNVSADQVLTSFKEAFDANGVNASSPAVAAFLQTVSSSGDASNGKTLTIVAEKLANGQEAITYEGNQGNSNTVRGDAGFIRDVFAIWLGNPADSGLAALKKNLVEGVK